MKTELLQETIENINNNRIELRKCSHCGKPFKLQEINVFGTKKVIQVLDCDCLEKIERAEEQRKIDELKKSKLTKLFENSLMTPLFQEKTFELLLKPENLEKYKNEAIILKCKKYAEVFNPEKSNGIQMIGSIGTGKTTLLAAVSNYLLRNGRKCLFTTFSVLFDRFSNFSFEHAGDITPLLNWLCEFDFIVLDDIGRETYTDKRKETAFRIIDTLLNHKKVVAITANPEMLEKLKKIPENSATLDRLKEMCKLKFEFKGKSLRGLND